MGGLVRQGVAVSVVYWLLVVAAAAIATAFGPNSFGDYLVFAAMIILGVTLLISAPLANQITTFEARVWASSSYRREDRAQQVGGLTAFGLMLMLVPQVALVSLLFT